MKPKQKEISIEDYNKKMDKLAKSKLSVYKILIKMLEYAGTVKLKEIVTKEDNNGRKRMETRNRKSK